MRDFELFGAGSARFCCPNQLVFQPRFILFRRVFGGIGEIERMVICKNQEFLSRIGLDAKGRWTRGRVAKVSLLVCPFWFLAQLTFNLSLKYTIVTSNTILSSASSLFTFLVALAFLGEKFTWINMISVLLCMGGTIIVSLGDSGTGLRDVASSPLLEDVLSLVYAAFYAVYITLIRLNLPEEDDERGHASMAQFLGFLGLFNLVLFFHVTLILEFAKVESFSMMTWKQFGLIIGKGLLFQIMVLMDLMAIKLLRCLIHQSETSLRVPEFQIMVV